MLPLAARNTTSVHREVPGCCSPARGGQDSSSALWCATTVTWSSASTAANTLTSTLGLDTRTRGSLMMKTISEMRELYLKRRERMRKICLILKFSNLESLEKEKK